MSEPTFGREFIKDSKYIKELVQQATYTITPLIGKAIITHVGGNGRFKFTLDNIEYTTEFADYVCSSNLYNHPMYFDYSQVAFNRPIKSEWSALYNFHKSKDYWKELPSCPKCGSHDVSKDEDHHYTCNICNN